MTTENLPSTEEEPRYESVVHEILCKLHKPSHVQEVLLAARNQIVLDRAYMRLDFSGNTTNEAIAASAYSLAQLHILDLILSSGLVHEI